MLCPACQTPNAPDATSCAACGAALAPPYVSYAAKPPPTANNGLAIASLVLGIVGFIAICVPFLALLPNGAAVVLGLMALKSSRRSMAMAGLVLGSVGLLSSIVWSVCTAHSLAVGDRCPFCA